MSLPRPLAGYSLHISSLSHPQQNSLLQNPRYCHLPTQLYHDSKDKPPPISPFRIRMALLHLSSLFATSYRSNIVPPVTFLHTLASTYASSPDKHNNNNNDHAIPWVSLSSTKRKFSPQSLSTDIASSATTNPTVDGYPEYSRLLPCPPQNSPPRVEHLVVTEEGPVLEFICKSLGLPPLFVADLIHFGAVYYALVCPRPPPSATPGQIRMFEEFTTPSVLKKRASIKGKTVREAQKTFRITHVDQILEAGTYLRVHVHPKRFPRCYEIDWKSRIIAVADSFVVLDKAAGTSVGGSVDNIEESCATFATRVLGLATPLRTTHQIDNCSEGCVVFARSKEYCAVFHKKIREGLVTKLYLALAASPVPVGIITHYMRPVNIAPRIVSEDYIKGWQFCQLEVMECKKVPWPNAETEQKYCVEDCGWTSKNHAYECKINLLTGRTHQIRAQLAACGAPLVGDSMYMPATIAELGNPGLNPFGKYKKQYSSEEEEAVAVAEWIAQHGKEPNVAIGLQACLISWDDGKHVFKAGSPWWRCGMA